MTPDRKEQLVAKVMEQVCVFADLNRVPGHGADALHSLTAALRSALDEAAALGRPAAAPNSEPVSL